MVQGSVHLQHLPELHVMTHIMSSLLQVAPLWFMAQFTFNTSLSRTTVSSNTILASTASLVTYIMSCLLLGEAFLVVKLASILVCMAGQQRRCRQSPSISPQNWGWKTANVALILKCTLAVLLARACSIWSDGHCVKCAGSARHALL